MIVSRTAQACTPCRADVDMEQLFMFDPEGNGIELGQYRDTWCASCEVGFTCPRCRCTSAGLVGMVPKGAQGHLVLVHEPQAGCRHHSLRPARLFQALP